MSSTAAPCEAGLSLTLRHKPAVHVASIGLLAGSIGWLVSSPSLRSLAAAVIAALIAVASHRSLVVIRDDVVAQRGLFGWAKHEVRLDELSSVSLRREYTSKVSFPLTVWLRGPGRGAVRIECWAWDGWEHLVHRAGHYARELNADRDPVTDRRMACTDRCPWAAEASELVSGRKAPAPEDGLTWMEAARVVALTFAFVFPGGAFWAWFVQDPDMTPLQSGLTIGGFYSLIMAVAMVCAKVDDWAGRSPSAPSPGPPSRAWDPQTGREQDPSLASEGRPAPDR